MRIIGLQLGCNPVLFDGLGGPPQRRERQPPLVMDAHLVRRLVGSESTYHPPALDLQEIVFVHLGDARRLLITIHSSLVLAPSQENAAALIITVEVIRIDLEGFLKAQERSVLIARAQQRQTAVVDTRSVLRPKLCDAAEVRGGLRPLVLVEQQLTDGLAGVGVVRVQLQCRAVLIECRLCVARRPEVVRQQAM